MNKYQKSSDCVPQRIVQLLIFVFFSLFAEFSSEAQTFDTLKICETSFPDTIYSIDTGIAYHWNTGDTASWLAISDSGTYSVTVTIDSSDSVINTFFILKWLPPIAQISLDIQLSSNSQLYLVPSGEYMADSNYYQWITPITTWPPDQAKILGISDPCGAYCDQSPEGEAEIVLIAFNQCGADTAFYNLFCEDYCPPLYTSEVKEGEKFSLWPNPASEFLSVSANSPIIQIDILNTQGNLLIQYPGIQNQYIEIRLAELTEGLYLLKIYTEKEIVTKRIIKQTK